MKMGKDVVEALVEGGKATAAPPLGPALGPMGVNIGKVVADINKKTEAFKGMQVPVKISIDKETKEYDISVGTPPASALIKKESGVEKGAANPKLEKVADLRIVQIIKIAKMKEDSLLGKDLKQKVKEVLGTCQSMGMLVEGVPAHEAIDMVNAGKFDKEISSGKTELTAEELKTLEAERKKLQEELKARREEWLNRAKAIVAGMVGKTTGEIKTKLAEAGIPQMIVQEVMPSAAPAAGADAKGAPAAGGKAATPAAGKAPGKK
jgi:large subunit ribosomal protein L11